MSESPRDFPKFAAGQTDPQTSARQMQNMSDAAKESYEQRYGPGMARTAAGTVAVIQEPKRAELPATRFVAIVTATPEQSTLVMVREIVTTLTADVPVNVWNGEPFPAYPAVGTSFTELANAVVDDSSPPSDTTPVFGLTKRRRGLPAVYKLGGGGGILGFAVVRDIGDGTAYEVIAEAVKWTGDEWVLQDDAGPIATYPGIPSRYYAGHVFTGSQASFDITRHQALRMFVGDGEVWLEHYIRWPAEVAPANLDFSECTPATVITP